MGSINYTNDTMHKKYLSHLKTTYYTKPNIGSKRICWLGMFSAITLLIPKHSKATIWVKRAEGRNQRKHQSETRMKKQKQRQIRSLKGIWGWKRKRQDKKKKQPLEARNKENGVRRKDKDKCLSISRKITERTDHMEMWDGRRTQKSDLFIYFFNLVLYCCWRMTVFDAIEWGC